MVAPFTCLSCWRTPFLDACNSTRGRGYKKNIKRKTHTPLYCAIENSNEKKKSPWIWIDEKPRHEKYFFLMFGSFHSFCFHLTPLLLKHDFLFLKHLEKMKTANLFSNWKFNSKSMFRCGSVGKTVMISYRNLHSIVWGFSFYWRKKKINKYYTFINIHF